MNVFLSCSAEPTGEHLVGRDLNNCSLQLTGNVRRHHQRPGEQLQNGTWNVNGDSLVGRDDLRVLLRFFYSPVERGAEAWRSVVPEGSE